MLANAGQYAKDEIVYSLALRIARDDNVQAFAVKRLFQALQEEIDRVCATNNSQ